MSESDERSLRILGGMIIADIEQLVKTISSKIKVDFRYLVTENLKEETNTGSKTHLFLFFVVLDLGSSSEEVVKTFIEDRMLEIFESDTMTQQNVTWAFEIRNKDKEEEGKKHGRED